MQICSDCVCIDLCKALYDHFDLEKVFPKNE